MLDVTLVSEDELQVSAHKLVLAASSSFFKSVLGKNPHSHPLIYLSGVTSSDLLHVLDYIYQGQVEMREEQVESFLAVSSKLRIAGIGRDNTGSTTPATASSLLNPPPDIGLSLRPEVILNTNEMEYEGLETDETTEKETLELDEDIQEIFISDTGKVDSIEKAKDEKKNGGLKTAFKKKDKDIRENHPDTMLADFLSRPRARLRKFKYNTDPLEVPSSTTNLETFFNTDAAEGDIIEKSEDGKTKDIKDEVVKTDDAVERKLDVEDHPEPMLTDFLTKPRQKKIETKTDFLPRPEPERFFITDVSEAEAKILELVSTDEKGFYLCGVCDFKTHIKHGCKSHIESRHIEGLQFGCDFCEKTFRNRNLLKTHRSKIHSSGKSRN